MSKFRDFEIKREGEGQPIRLTWAGDYDVPPKPSRAQKDAAKLAEYERVYGKREEDIE